MCELIEQCAALYIITCAFHYTCEFIESERDTVFAQYNKHHILYYSDSIELCDQKLLFKAKVLLHSYVHNFPNNCFKSCIKTTTSYEWTLAKNTCQFIKWIKRGSYFSQKSKCNWDYYIAPTYIEAHTYMQLTAEYIRNLYSWSTFWYKLHS